MPAHAQADGSPADECHNGGAGVNTASVGAFNAGPVNAVHSASKVALVSYTRSLAYTHGSDGIRANAAAPVGCARK